MVLFWIFAALMLALALYFILPPLLGRGASPRHNAETGLATQRERLASLSARHERGELSAEQYASARDAVARALVENLESTAAPAGSRGTRTPAWIAGSIALALPAISVALYLWLGSTQSLVPNATTAPPGAEQAAASIERMVENLAQKLQANPDDAQGWLMLARSYQVLERYALSADAFGRAHELLGDDPKLLADYAEVAALANANQLAGLPASLIETVLALDPENQKGLWLAGFASLQDGDAPAAIDYWTRLLQQMPEGSEQADQVRAMITQAGGEVQGADAMPEPAARSALRVRVSISAALADRVSGEETLFVFARALDGPPMPLAIQRLTAAEIPLTVSLDDSMGMLPAMKLSNFPQVLVGARVSRSGDAEARSGDLRGSVSPVTVGNDGLVALTIDEQVP